MLAERDEQGRVTINVFGDGRDLDVLSVLRQRAPHVASFLQRLELNGQAGKLLTVNYIHVTCDDVQLIDMARQLVIFNVPLKPNHAQLSQFLTMHACQRVLVERKGTRDVG